MKQKRVALVGISGVGKTTFLKNVAKTCAFQHLTADSLIARARSAVPETRDDLRLSDVDENQSLLVRGFADACDPQVRLVILDGHVVIHTETGLVPIESRVFALLGIDLIAHLEGDPAQIHENRAQDHSRDRPVLSLDELRGHQVRSLAGARRVATDLGIVVRRVEHDAIDEFRRLMASLSEQ